MLAEFVSDFRDVASSELYHVHDSHYHCIPMQTMAIENSSCRYRSLMFHAHDMKYNVLVYDNESSRSVDAVFLPEMTNCHAYNAVCLGHAPSLLCVMRPLMSS